MNTQNHNCNHAVYKLDLMLPITVAEFLLPPYLCAPASVDFINLSHNADIYEWNFGDGHTSDEFEPSHEYTEEGTYYVTLIAIDTTGTCNGSDTVIKPISIYDVDAVISDTSFTDCDGTCSGTATVTPSGGLLPYIYDWSDGQSGPTADSLCVGTYYVTVTDQAGCYDIDTTEIADPSDLYIEAEATSAQCYDSCDATASVTAYLGAEPYTYIWTDTDGNQIGSYDFINNLCNGYYYVAVIDSENCVRTKTVQVTQPDSIYAEITIISDTICFDDSVDAHVQAYGGTPEYSYYWGPPLNTTDQTVTDLPAGQYWVTVIDENGCPDSLGFVFTNPPPLNMDSLIIGAICETCYGTIIITPEGGAGTYSYEWSTPGEIDSIISGLDGGYYYDVTVTDAWNCTMTGTFYVSDTVWDPPLDAWADPDTIFAGQSSQLEATHGYQIYDWTEITPPGTGSLDDPTVYDPLATPDHTTTYLVHILDSCGCESWDTVQVVVEDYICGEPFIYIPNAFSPNGDGINDVLYVRSEVADQLYLAIYDRWGQLVFVTEDFNKGWDGTFNGKLVDPAVFAYYLKARCMNMEIYEKKGNITVVR